MTSEECASRITGYREEYVSGFKNKNTHRVFMDSLSLIIDAAGASDLAKRTAELIDGRITNPAAVSIITADFKSAENTARKTEEECSRLINTSSASNESNLNVYIITDGASLSKEMYEAIHKTVDKMQGVYINISVYGICVINEVQTDITLVKKDRRALEILSEYTDRDYIFALGRRKLNGKLISAEKAVNEYSQMLCNLIINSQNILLPKGAFSLGMASVLKCAETFWTEFLLRESDSVSNPDDNGGELVTDEDALRFSETINNILNDKYSNNISIDIMRNILCNDDSVYNDDDIKTVAEKLYGKSLEVYLDNERAKAQKALAALKDSYDDIIGRVNASGRNQELLRRAVGLLEEQIRNIRANSEYVSVPSYDAFGERSVRTEIFRQYLQPETMKIVSRYYIEGLDIAVLAVKAAIDKYNERIKAFSELRDSVHSIAVNYINTEGQLRIDYDMPEINASKLRDDGYIDYVCSEINNALKTNNSFRKMFDSNKNMILSYLADKAEPYCCNNNYNVDKSYYALGNSEYIKEVAALDSNVKTLDAEYLEDGIFLNCSRIELDVFIEMI